MYTPCRWFVFVDCLLCFCVLFFQSIRVVVFVVSCKKPNCKSPKRPCQNTKRRTHPNKKTPASVVQIPVDGKCAFSHIALFRCIRQNSRSERSTIKVIFRREKERRRPTIAPTSVAKAIKVPREIISPTVRYSMCDRLPTVGSNCTTKRRRADASSCGMGNDHLK